MTDLKTLKDLDKMKFICDNCNKEFLEIPSYTELTLKAEAIKWVKKIRAKDKGWNHNNSLNIDGQKIMCAEYHCDNVENWIINFFNLTEEDLK